MDESVTRRMIDLEIVPTVTTCGLPATPVSCNCEAATEVPEKLAKNYRSDARAHQQISDHRGNLKHGAGISVRIGGNGGSAQRRRALQDLEIDIAAAKRESVR